MAARSGIETLVSIRASGRFRSSHASFHNFWNALRRRALTEAEKKTVPIFHFEIADGVRLEDPVGLDCKSEREAKETADLIARQIATDLQSDSEDRAVLVIDEAGLEIYKAPVRL
jgi:uncharacterized protein DUF6894